MRRNLAPAQKRNTEAEQARQHTQAWPGLSSAPNITNSRPSTRIAKFLFISPLHFQQLLMTPFTRWG